MNIDLKVELIRHFGSQIVAAKKLRIQNSKLSYLVHGHAEPSKRERDVLKKALGADYFEKESPSAA
jgi:hypothetical protein